MQISIKAGVYDTTSTLIWSPLQVDFGDILVGKKGKVSVELTNQGSKRNELVVLSSPSEKFIKKFKIKKKKLKPGKSTKIEFELAKDIAPGRFFTSLTLEAKGNPQSRITIPIKGEIVTEQSLAKKESQAKAALKKKSAKRPTKNVVDTKAAQKKDTKK